jgi:hypothetical protein
MVKWLTLLFNIREVPHSNLGLKTGYPKFFRGFPQFLQANARIIRGTTALTNLGRLSSRRWQYFPTAPDGNGLTCGQHIESHSCIFSFPNRTVTSIFK